MWNIRHFLGIAIVGVGPVFAASSPALATCDWAGGYGAGGCGAYSAAGWGFPYVLAPTYGWGGYRPGGPYDVGWEGSGYGWGNNWGYLELTPSRRIAPPILTLRPPS
jgi:hypothetical protein